MSILWLGFLIADRSLEAAQVFIHQVSQLLAPGCVPLFLSDRWKPYAISLLTHFGHAAYLDNVLSQYNAFTRQLNTGVGKPRHKEMVAMKFPFPDMLTLKGNVITQDVQIMQKDAEIVLRDLITDVRLAYYDHLWDQR